MPNWCDNRVTLNHEDSNKIDAIERELEKWDNGEGDCQLFNTLVPRPASEEEKWYDWNIDNWGTKWDANISSWSRDDSNNITVYFETAWSPPLKLYYTLLDEYYTIDAVYHESGMSFCGWFDNGNDNYHEYDISDLDSINAMPEEILEFTNLREWHEDWKDSESFEQPEYNLDDYDSEITGEQRNN
jgi:hypothetical protein